MHRFATLRDMSKPTRKFIALLMLLWLPLSLGNALAASLAMQLSQGSCHEAMEMDDPHMMMQHELPAHDDVAMQADDQAANCTSCGICHLACSAWLDAPAVAVQLTEAGSQAVPFFHAAFLSHLSTPLLPPPLVSA